MELLLRHFGLTGKERGNRQVPCPFHEDANASASINLKKGVLHCFTCKKGWSLAEVTQHLEQRQPQVEEEPVPVPVAGVTEEELLELGGRVLEERGVQAAVDAAPFEVSVDTDPESPLFGYLVFDLDKGRVVARNLLEVTRERPRYRNTKGEKGLAWVTEDDPNSAVWLVEGIFDALSLAEVGAKPAAAALGSELSDGQAYELRGRTVFVAFDADVAGYTGARAAAKKLEEFGATPIVVDPPTAGKDFNEALVADRDALERWVVQQRAEFGHSDEEYLLRQLEGDEELLVIPTQLGGYDDLLGGGYKSGVHTVGAEPGVGKTSFALRYARLAAEAGWRVLYITYEISKRQCWARLASSYDPLAWSVLENGLHQASATTKKLLLRLGQRLRVASGWNVNKITHAARGYDLVVVDYLQRMPGPFGETDARHNIDHNVSRLSNLARDLNKVILVISSLPRSDYGARITKKSFKESGGIEYMSQSLTGLVAQGHGTIMGTVVKNTRGKEGVFWLKSDLGHLRFEWSKPPGGGK